MNLSTQARLLAGKLLAANAAQDTVVQLSAYVMAAATVSVVRKDCREKFLNIAAVAYDQMRTLKQRHPEAFQ